MRSTIMNASTHKRALQIAIAVAGLVPVGAGFAGVTLGPRFARLGDPIGFSTDATLDSHFRYLSGLLLGIGLIFWSMIPTIERRGLLVRALTLIVFIGGLGRAVSLLQAGEPDTGMRWALLMELVVTPLLCLWQWRVERQFNGEVGRTLRRHFPAAAAR
jgi:hypothetical protein